MERIDQGSATCSLGRAADKVLRKVRPEETENRGKEARTGAGQERGEIHLSD